MSSDESVKNGMSDSSREISDFNFDMDELNVSIHPEIEITPIIKTHPKRLQKSYITTSDAVNSKSTNKKDENSKDQISVLSSKNLLVEFDQTADSLTKKLSSGGSHKKPTRYQVQPKITPKEKIKANKIRTFSTKFKTCEGLPLKTTVQLNKNSQDAKLSEICATLSSKHYPNKPIKSSKHNLKKPKIQYKPGGGQEPRSRNTKVFGYTQHELKTCKTSRNILLGTPVKGSLKGSRINRCSYLGPSNYKCQCCSKANSR